MKSYQVQDLAAAEIAQILVFMLLAWDTATPPYLMFVVSTGAILRSMLVAGYARLGKDAGDTEP